jgi:lysophospholipase L1-like esterase
MIRTMRILLFILLLLLCPASAAPLLKAGDRVLVLGDSNTHNGLYIAALDLMVRCRMPGVPVEFINAGLASETLSGTSEKHHPWPRPDVHERAARAMEKAKPTVVAWCYGMNDGIYAPPDAERMAKFQQGTRDLVQLSRTAGARVIIMTPPPFDPRSYKGELAEDGFEDYGYKTPWRHYNRTLAGYADWLRNQPNLADAVVDLHGPLTHIIESWHHADPKWSSGDGIHPIAAIHWVMAALIAEEIGIPGAVAELDAGERDAQGGWTFNVNAAPPLAAPEGTPDGFFLASGFQKLANRFELTLPVAPAAALRLKNSYRLLGIVTREQVARGLDLTKYPALSLNRDAAAAMPLALERHRILSTAWREHIGHTRPDTDRNALPLEEAKAAAAKIEEKLNALLDVRQETLRLEPVGQ